MNPTPTRAASWDKQFDDPILPSTGKPLVTLRNAANYILELPKKESALPEWQAAMQALILVAETNGPTMLARIGVMKALNRNVPRVFSDRKEKHWEKRKLKRDE